jgi:hypothetical protein
MKKSLAVLFSIASLTSAVLAWVYTGMAVFQENIMDARVAFVTTCCAIVGSVISGSLNEQR